MANASGYVMNLDQRTFEQNTDPRTSHIKVGTGKACFISDLSEPIADITESKGALERNISEPDGTPRKLLDIRKLRELGWEAGTTLEDERERTHA